MRWQQSGQMPAHDEMKQTYLPIGRDESGQPPNWRIVSRAKADPDRQDSLPTSARAGSGKGLPAEPTPIARNAL